MIINPQVAVRSGIVIGVEKPDEQIQPNGIDVRLDRVMLVHVMAELRCEGKKPIEMEPLAPDPDGFYNLRPFGPYHFMCLESIKLPVDMAATIHGRSTLNRTNILCASGLYDSGFDNRIGFAVYPFNHVRIERGARVAQVVLWEAKSASLYRGEYQDGGRCADQFSSSSKD